MLRTMQQAVRSVLREPMLAVLSIAALALGIGLPTAMFSLVDGAVMRGLPFANSERILHAERRPHGARGEGWGAHARDFLVWQERQRSFEALAAFHRKTVTLRSESGSDRQQAALVTPNTFDLVGVAPLLGRTFTPSASESEVVLAHHVWRDRFGGASDVIGKTVWVDGQARTVTGVMPEDFHFPDKDDLWLPLRIDAAAAANPDFPMLDVFGKLREGSSHAAAQAEFDIIGQQTAQLFPEANQNMGVAIKRFTARFIGETATITMYVMLAAVLLVLLIACINVANLLLVRAVHRGREIAIRAALGGTRRAIAKQLFAESLVMAIGGGVAGLLVASLATSAMGKAFSPRMPFWVEIRMDARALLFAIGATLAAALIAAVLPAIKASRRDLSATLLDTSRGGTSLRVGRVMRLMIALEIALSTGLLVPAVLMLKGVQNLEHAPRALTPDNVFTARVTLSDRYDAGARVRYYDQLRGALLANPTVSQATIATTVPTDRASNWRFSFEGATYNRPEDRPRARRIEIGDDFFATFGSAVLQGRGFGTEDRADTEPVAIVNERFVQQHLSDKQPLGQRIRLGDDNEPWRRIIGVVPNLWAGGMDASPPDRNPAAVYLPIAQAAPTEVTIAARTRSGDPLQLTDAVRRAAFQLDPDVPLYQVRSLPQVFEDNSWFYAFGAGIMLVCASSALLLAMIGLYGVVAFSVGRRVREFGIRMAVGAIRGDIIRLVLRQGAAQIVVGVALGLGLAIVLSGGVASLLFGVRPTDPLVLTGVAALLIGIALAATLIPALRAARIDPLTALREA